MRNNNHRVNLDGEKPYLESRVKPVRELIDETLSDSAAGNDYARVVVNAIKLQDRWIDRAFLQKPHKTVEDFRDKCERLSELRELHEGGKIRDIPDIVDGFRHTVRENLANDKMDAGPEERVENVRDFLKDRLTLDDDVPFIKKKVDKLVKENLVRESFKDLYNDSEISTEVYEYLT